MNMLQEIIAHSQEMKQVAVPHISLDSVIIGFPNSVLSVLLLQTKGQHNWILPGGYVLKNENIDDAVKRMLKERTGVSDVFLQQFSTFGNANRSQEYFKNYPDDLWHKQRFISIAYYALVDSTQVKPELDQFTDKCAWVPLTEIGDMEMDHKLMIDKSIAVLREQLLYKPIGLNLLPKEFTLPELQHLYESILGYKLNRGNFYRKIMRYGVLVKLDKTRKGGSHKAPDLYRFDEEKYSESLTNFTW